MSPKEDNDNREMVMASWYALTIQMDVAGEVLRSLAMEGSATLVMVPSNTDTVIPNAMAKIAQYREGKGNPSCTEGGVRAGAGVESADCGVCEEEVQLIVG